MDWFSLDVCSCFVCSMESSSNKAVAQRKIFHSLTKQALCCSYNFKERSCNYCCCRKVIFVKYSEHVFVALVTRHEEHKCGIILSHFLCPIVPYYFTLFRNGENFENETCVPIFPTTFVWKLFGRSCDRPLRHRFFGFPVSISKCWEGSQDSKLPLHASHVALPT